MKSQIQNKKNGGIVELLIPTLNKIIRNQGTYFVVIMNNRLKIISVRGAPAPLKYGRNFFQKQLLLKGQKLFWAKKLWGGCSNRWTNDQIMAMSGRSFLNDKCIFQ